MDPETIPCPIPLGKKKVNAVQIGYASANPRAGGITSRKLSIGKK
jgi:hypothetical protein